MKRKYAAITLGLMLGVMTLGGCAGTNTEDTAVSDSKENTEDKIYGQVKEVGISSITIETGTMKQMEQPESGEEKMTENDGTESETTESETTESETTESETEDNKMEGEPPTQGGEQPSILDLTGEEQEIAVTEDTVITRQSMGGGGQPQGNQGEAPEKPDGEMPDGEIPEGEAPEMPQGEEITLEDIAEGDTISVTLDEDGNAAEITVMSMGGAPGGDMGQSQGVDSYDAANEYTTDTEIDGETLTSTGTDENAVHVFEGADVTLNHITVNRSSSDSTGGDNSSFYGVGAAVLTTDGTSYISGSSIATDAAGGAGIFAYGDGTVYAADTTITTRQDTSGGIHAAGGGTLYAWNMNVETDGESSAAIRSDRGGGTMVVDGGSYTSNGVGSPAVYSTADIAVNEAELTANGSEAVCIEGLNSLHLYDTDLTGNMSDDDQNDCTWNVILYQSMSGDSEVGNSTFEMNGGTLTAQNGGMFYTTNTESTITLSDVDITYAEDSEFFLQCTGNQNQRGWGQSGANGADCLFTGIAQEMEGDVIWDSISSLDFYMTEGSSLEGAVVQDNTWAGDGQDGYCNFYLGEGCTWTVTGDSQLSQLSNAGTIVDEDGKTVTIKGSDGTVYAEGNSSYTITVDSYEETADLSGASESTSWAQYQTERPEAFN